MLSSNGFEFSLGFFISGWIFFVTILMFIKKLMSNSKKPLLNFVAIVMTNIASLLCMLYCLISDLSTSNAYRVIASIICAAAVTIDMLWLVKDFKTEFNKKFH